MSERIQCGNRRVAALSATILLLGLIATAARTVKQYQPIGPFDPNRQGMCDFHNGIYFPAQALLAGVSPYGPEYVAKYPIERQIPFFSPVTLVLHAPLAVLPLRVAEIAYFLISVAIIIAIGFLSASAAGMPGRLDAALAIAAALVVSRGGHTTLFNGYFTLEIVLACLLSVHWGKHKPFLAAVALVLVSTKPTYILPLGFLLLARGNFKAVLIGAVLSIAAAAGPFLWLASHEGDGDLGAGLAAIAEQIGEAQEAHQAVADESPVRSWTRIDLLTAMAKVTGREPSQTMHLVVMAVLLIVPMWVLDRRRRLAVDDGVAGMTGAITLSAVLVSLYHQSYDALVMVAPLAGVLICRLPPWRRLRFSARMAIAVLMLVPAYNYLSTRMILGHWKPSPVVVQFLTSTNAVSLAILLALVCWLGATRPAEETPSECDSMPSQQV